MSKINIQNTLDNSRFNNFHWQVLFWCAVLVVFDGYDIFIFSAVLPVLMDTWKLSPIEAGILSSYALYGMMFGALIFGSIATKLGLKKTILLCSLLFSSSTFLCSFTNSPMQFGICRFMAGFGVGGVLPNVVALISEYSPKKSRNILTTIMFSGFPLGGILSAFLGKILIPSQGWQSVFWVGIIPILLLPIIYRYLPDSLHFLIRSGNKTEAQKVLSKLDPNYNPTDSDEFEIAKQNSNKGKFNELFASGKGLSTAMYWLAFFMCLLMVYGLSSWLPKLMTQAGYGFSSSLNFLLALNLGAMLGAILGGYLGDKFNLHNTIIVFFLIAAISISQLGFKNSTFILYLFSAIAGATTNGTSILMYSLVAQSYSSDLRTKGIGWASGIGRLGAIIGPQIGGILLSKSLPFQQNFYAFAFAGVIAALSIIIVKIKSSL